MSGVMDDIHEQLVEMGQIKTQFDIEKFTVGKEGDFVASQFHFLMRQYRFAVQETRRILVDYEKAQREVEFLKKEYRYREAGDDYEVSSPATRARLYEIEHLDLEILTQESLMRSLEIDITGKIRVIAGFETMRQALIKENGGKPPTNEQYQAEQPAYYEWLLSRKVLQELQARQTGLSLGLIDAHYMAARDPLLDDSKMKITPIVTDLGRLLLDDIHKKGLRSCDGVLKELKIPQNARKELIEEGLHGS